MSVRIIRSWHPLMIELSPQTLQNKNFFFFSSSSSSSPVSLIGTSTRNSRLKISEMSITTTTRTSVSDEPKVIDSHLHVWASPQEALDKYPYFPGQEPTLPGHVHFLLQHMEEAGVDGALIVQPINHKFDHSYVTSILKKYPSKFIGCCLANPEEDGSGIKQLEELVSKDGYRAVRFNPYLWPSSQAMTNDVGKALFSKAGELGVPIGFMCMKGLDLHLLDIEQLCTEFPSTVVLLDHLAFCKPPTSYEEEEIFSKLLKLSRFPQVYVKFSALFRVSRQSYPYLDLSDILSKVVSSYGANRVMWGRFPQVYVKFSALFRVSRQSYPYLDLSDILSKVVSSYGANRVMWGSDFPYIVPECGYKEAKEAVRQIVQHAKLTSSDLEWIMGRTVYQIFNSRWSSSLILEHKKSVE